MSNLSIPVSNTFKFFIQIMPRNETINPRFLFCVQACKIFRSLLEFLFIMRLNRKKILLIFFTIVIYFPCLHVYLVWILFPFVISVILFDHHLISFIFKLFVFLNSVFAISLNFVISFRLLDFFHKLWIGTLTVALKIIEN